MDDPTIGTEGVDALALSEATAPADLARPVPGAGCKLSVGARWRGFHVEAIAPGGSPYVFEATNIGLMETVLIVAAPVTKATEWRKVAWQKLSTQMPPDGRILRCVEAFAEDGWRYEVMNRPPMTNLREWMYCHQADGAVQRILLEQLTVALTALHAAGIVHLNIRPEAIYVDEKDNQIEVVVGGLEAATLYNQSDFAVSALDPFYAPPEAANPGGALPGIGLCAWDWWTLGRVMQELVLGRPVMSQLFGADVVRDPTPRLRAQAEALLLEREPPGMRPGAVESMNELDGAVETMLRGLLTTARDARWGRDAVRRWLAKGNVSQHYGLSRDARFFNWKGRGLTVAEAAEYFCTPENWADGEENILNPQNPATLASFLSSTPEGEADWRKLQKVGERMAAPEWGEVPPPARRTLTTALAWFELGAQPGSFNLGGQRLDARGLAVLLSDNQNAYNYANVTALMSAPGLALLKPLDPVAAETLALVAAVANEALRRAAAPGWVNLEDPGAQAQVLQLALESASSLRARADRVRASYPTNRDPELAHMLADSRAEPWANLLLVITADDPRRFGYVTKAEHARQQFALLEGRSEQLRLAVFWLRLRRLLRAGGPCLAGWVVFVCCWLTLVGIGVAVAHEVTATLWLAAGLVGLRLLFSWRVRVLVHKSDPGVKSWSWHDGPRRCLTEAARIWPEDAAGTLSALTRSLTGMETEMAGFALADSKVGVRKNRSLARLWLGLAAGALLCGLGSVRLVVGISHTVKAQIANFSDLRTQAQALVEASRTAEAVAEPLPPIPGFTLKMREKLAQGEYEIVDEGFGKKLRGPLTKWEMTAPPDPVSLGVEARMRASAAQRAYALVSAELLLRPYGRKAVNALLIVRVPTENKFGLMVYNARDRRLMDNDALVVREEPRARTWYRFDNRNLVFLGPAPESKKEISLALR